jgi:hypothetical protein
MKPGSTLGIKEVFSLQKGRAYVQFNSIQFNAIQYCFIAILNTSKGMEFSFVKNSI